MPKKRLSDEQIAFALLQAGASVLTRGLVAHFNAWRVEVAARPSEVQQCLRFGSTTTSRSQFLLSRDEGALREWRRPARLCDCAGW